MFLSNITNIFRSFIINCECGAMIIDQTDFLPNKAYFIPDQKWFQLLDAMDDAIELSGKSARAKEAACMKMRVLIGGLSKHAWQCSSCGALYLESRNGELQHFKPADDSVSRSILSHKG